MTDQARRDEDQQREAAVAAFMEVANALLDSLPQMVEDNMERLSQEGRDPATGMAFSPQVWRAVWAATGMERFNELLDHDHDELYTLLRAMWRRKLKWEEHAGT